MIPKNTPLRPFGLPVHDMLHLDAVPGVGFDSGERKPIVARAALGPDLEPDCFEDGNLYDGEIEKLTLLLRIRESKPKLEVQKPLPAALRDGERDEVNPDIVQALLTGLREYLGSDFLYQKKNYFLNEPVVAAVPLKMKIDDIGFDFFKQNSPLDDPDLNLYQNILAIQNKKLPLRDIIGVLNHPELHSRIPTEIQPVSDPRPDADGRIRIRGMLIPVGFTPIKMWREAHPGLEPDTANIRYLYIPNHNSFDPKSYYGEVFVVDPENTEWQATLGQYKRNTKTLERLLQDRLDEADIPLWVRNTRRPSRAKDFRRVRMILCPTPFSSDVEGVDRIMQRNQPKDGADESMIHIDEAGKLCLVRRYSRADTEQSNQFRCFVGTSIHLQQEQIEAVHGDMARMADILFKILADGYEMYYMPMAPAADKFVYNFNLIKDYTPYKDIIR